MRRNNPRRGPTPVMLRHEASQTSNVEMKPTKIWKVRHQHFDSILMQCFNPTLVPSKKPSQASGVEILRTSAWQNTTLCFFQEVLSVGNEMYGDKAESSLLSCWGTKHLRIHALKYNREKLEFITTAPVDYSCTVLVQPGSSKKSKASGVEILRTSAWQNTTVCFFQDV